VADRIFGWKPAVVTPEWGLRDIPSSALYATCNSLECAECGLVFLDMRFDDEEMARLYHGYRDGHYNSLRETYEPGYIERNAGRLDEGSAHVQEVEAFLLEFMDSPRAVLDIGGHTGANTPFRGRLVLHAVLDISEAPLVSGAVPRSDLEALNNQFDLVVLSHVLEHVAFPIEKLNEAGRFMGSDAHLYVEVPVEDFMLSPAKLNAETVRRGATKRHWHEHINAFTQVSLESALTVAGLEVVALQRRTVDLPGVANEQMTIYQVLARRA